MHHWAPVGRPLITRSKWSGSPCVVVCGYISEERGLVHMQVEQKGSFNGFDMGQQFDVVVNEYENGSKLVLHGDGARINLSKEAKASVLKPINKDTLVHQTTNLPYRPDLMGVGKSKFNV